MTPHLFDLSAIGAGLPVATAQTELEAALRTGAAVITAPPGSGKTTFVPALVANMLAEQAATTRDSQVTLLSQPRRVAVRAAARRIASLDDPKLGGPVGFTVRGEHQASADTQLLALTPGVLIRRLLSDPGLDGVGAVILDEVHERSVDGDLLLGMLADLRELRPELLVVAMSATLEAEAVSELLGAAVVHVPAALHPLEISYAPAAGARLDERGVTRDFLQHVAHLAVTAQASTANAAASTATPAANTAAATADTAADALVFVPGAREVDEVVRAAQAIATPGSVEVLPLHGRLSSREQDRAVGGRAPGDPPRIVVSTSLAESSLTVPGVRLVIDAGLSREVRRDRARDMAGLVTVSAARASADQRAGRAAREGAGRAIRAYSEADFARMPAAVTPEILSADLTDAALFLAVWGTPGAAGLRLLTPPPAAALAAATRVLTALELTDAQGRATPLGARVAALPIGVREARALISGAAELGDADQAADIVAALSSDLRAPDADLARLLRELRTGRNPGAGRWRQEAKRLARLARAEASESRALNPAEATTEQASPATASTSGEAAGDPVGRVLALARPEWIARRTGSHSRSYLMASGTRAALPEGSSLIGSEWLAVREVQLVAGRAGDGTGAVIRTAATLHEDNALRLGHTLRSSERAAAVIDGRVRVREETRLGAIVLASTPASPGPDDTKLAYLAHLSEVGLGALNWTEAAVTLRARLAILHRELGTPWPAVDDAALTERLDDWLGPQLDRVKPGTDLGKLDVAGGLRLLLPWPEATALDSLVPERLQVPSGSDIRIDYAAAGEDGTPVVAVKLQELFGLAESPTIVNGQVKLLFHLLSPARKPLAITNDLSSFWNGPYAEVRKEMRGRYPKHPWPQDPWSAQATARTKRASAGYA